MSSGLKERVSLWDSLDIGGTILGVVFPEDGECREDRSRAFRVVMFDHGMACDAFSMR